MVLVVVVMVVVVVGFETRSHVAYSLESCQRNSKTALELRVLAYLLAQSQWVCHGESEHGGLLFQDRVSLCSPGCPGTHSVDQAGLELTEICLPLLPKC